MNFKKNIPLSLYNILKGGLQYPVPPSINYFWNFGSLSLLAFICQLITGIFLAMHYCSDINYAFLSVEHIMRDVNNGWLIRYIHANGASLFFYGCLYSYFTWFILWFFCIS